MPVPVDPAITGDPAAFMTKAADINGLTGPDIQPWHIKVSFKLLDDQGKTQEEGTYEEFWARANEFKRTYTSEGFTQTDFGTETGILRTGSQTPIPAPLSSLRSLILQPLPSKRAIREFPFTVDGFEIVGIKLVCLTMKWKAESPDPQPTMARYCFDQPTSTLRFSYGGQKMSIAYSGKTTFQGHALPLNVVVGKEKTVELTAHLESVERIDRVSDADFAPPADARPVTGSELTPVGYLGPVVGQGVPGGIGFGVPGPASMIPRVQDGEMISSTIAKEHLLHQVAPVYPPIAKAARIQGTVVLTATISKAGEVESLKVVSGNPLLQQAALDAVRQWTYKPYLVDGQPREVLATVNVVFVLDNQAPVKKIAVSAGVAQAMLMKRVQPVYPPDAKAAGVSGTVVLRATISTEGEIKDLQVVSGHPMLQTAALDAVKQWLYQPYLLNGEPVEIDTTINVVFSLGSAPAK